MWFLVNEILVFLKSFLYDQILHNPSIIINTIADSTKLGLRVCVFIIFEKLAAISLPLSRNEFLNWTAKGFVSLLLPVFRPRIIATLIMKRKREKWRKFIASTASKNG